MKKTNIIAMALAGLVTLPVIAGEASEPTAGDILQGINMFTPEDGDPAYKVKANDKYGTQWAVDAAYGYWQSNNTIPGTHNHTNFFLVHAQLNQRIVEDSVNGGTWIRAEFSGSWALDGHTSRKSAVFSEGFGNASGLHADALGSSEGVIPELAIMHYFNNKRACIIGGMVNLTNYFDAVSIANDTFCSFANDGFVNSTVLPLSDSNLGAVFQYELDGNDYVMLGVSRTGCEAGDNPFTSDDINGYVVVGEWGHIFADGAATFRLNPFYQRIDVDFGDERGEYKRSNWGLAASIEYAVNDMCTVYSRAGLAHHDHIDGNAGELSVGANLKLFPSREDDFFGISYGIFKGAVNNNEGYPYIDEESGGNGNRHEQVLELMYSFQVNDYFKITPHYQLIIDPCYRAVSSESLWGVQAVLSF